MKPRLRRPLNPPIPHLYRRHPQKRRSLVVAASARKRRQLRTKTRSGRARIAVSACISRVMAREPTAITGGAVDGARQRVVENPNPARFARLPKVP